MGGIATPALAGGARESPPQARDCSKKPDENRGARSQSCAMLIETK